jgi:hypothetical protein
VSILTDLPGRTAAYRVAEVRRPMSCVVLKRLVTEGREVKAGSSYTCNSLDFRPTTPRLRGIQDPTRCVTPLRLPAGS